MNRCHGMTKNMRRCKKNVKFGEFCHIHNIDECPVCYEVTKLKKFPCTHGTCEVCFLRLNNTCPMCRAVILPQLTREELILLVILSFGFL